MEEKKTEEKKTEVKETPKKQDRPYNKYKKKDTSGKYRKFDRKKFIFKKKFCFFCKNKEAVIDYKDVGLMRRFISESGKITPRRFSGTCAKHQRKLAIEIKKARQMALISFTEK
ncbi:MAG TPA: 30S ribosomal protein S18 [Candidatus Cloacimonetes bacterium]|nr:30S ribosomal protein S18 [Candidatus Cloacimonadota bacterium]